MARQILVTGAASGIGKAFVQAYLSQPNNQIYAVDISFRIARDTDGSETQKLQQKYKEEVNEQSAAINSSIVAFKACDLSSAEEIQKMFDNTPAAPLDIVIHSAGIRGLVPNAPIASSADVAKAETMQIMDVQTLQRAFNVNVVGSFLFLRAVMKWMRPRTGKVVIMGSRMGSIESNSTGGAFAYRASKAALNAIIKSFSIDAQELIFVTLHPGRVETGLVAVKEDGAMTARESIREMLSLIERLQKSDSGRFMDRFGVDIPW